MTLKTKTFAVAMLAILATPVLAAEVGVNGAIAPAAPIADNSGSMVKTAPAIVTTTTEVKKEEKAEVKTDAMGVDSQGHQLDKGAIKSKPAQLKTDAMVEIKK